MLLKRKRSDSELSFSSNTTFSSPPRPNYYNFSAMAMMDIDSPVSPRTSLSSRPCTPSHLPSRTLTRFRDSRPSDEEVHRKFYEWRAHHQQHQHQYMPSSSFSPSPSLPSPPPPAMFSSCVASTEHTLKILYEAQQQQQHQHPHYHQQEQPQQQVPSACSPPVASLPPQSQPSSHGQRSLHSFWNLPSASSALSSASTTPAPSTALPPAIETSSPAHCEDCGAGLGSEDVMMEDEYGFVGASSLCGACGKAVCFSCSVSNLGEQRRCLMCAGRKQWIGGIGWAVAGAGVC